MPKPSFRLFHAARDARGEGEAESDHGNLGMNGLCPEQNGLPPCFFILVFDSLQEARQADGLKAAEMQAKICG
jgi:hypothetical protein